MFTQTHTHPDSNARTGTNTDGPGKRRPLWGHWPSLLGLSVAAWQIAIGTSTDGTAITVAAAASCYLAAAALGRPWSAWVGILTSSLAVLLTEAAGIPWWAGLTAYAVLLVAVGLAGTARGVALWDSRCSASAAWPCLRCSSHRAWGWPWPGWCSSATRCGTTATGAATTWSHAPWPSSVSCLTSRSAWPRSSALT